MLRPDIQLDWLQNWLTRFMTKLICWPALKTERSAGAVAESEKDAIIDATQRECIHAVAIALQSWCLIKLRSGLLLQNFGLALETVSNGAFAEIIGVWLSLPSMCCTVAIMLDKVKLFTFFVVISFFNGTTSTAHPSHWKVTFFLPEMHMGALSSSVLADNV